ncbi:MAG TPA: DinB family protein [Mesorhizobium sp.]|nr:DinB family protein [Mesorhizobium sp.]
MPDAPPYPAARYFAFWAHNNAWSNDRLLRACATLSPEEFERERTSFFPSLLLTLNHNLTVDWFYVDALGGGSLGLAAFRDETPFREAEALRRAQADTDRRLIALCESLTDNDLGREVRLTREGGRVQRERTDRVLMHLFQHQIHHRGQAHAMLTGTAVAPPQLDEFFLADEAPLRASEVEALGWTETGLWGAGRSGS